MHDKQQVIAQIHAAFGANHFPGADFIQGSTEGCEPYDEVGPFRDQHDWRSVAAALLDAHPGALSFFSEAGFRFFLPAYLLADLDNQLSIADPLFHLTYAFSDSSVEIPTRARTFVRRLGRSAFVNARRYGAVTCYEYARCRLSVFAREEAGAIAAYLEYKRDADPDDLHRQQIDAALEGFWLDRACTAPRSADLKQHLDDEQAYLAQLERDANGDD